MEREWIGRSKDTLGTAKVGRLDPVVANMPHRKKSDVVGISHGTDSRSLHLPKRKMLQLEQFRQLAILQRFIPFNYQNTVPRHYAKNELKYSMPVFSKHRSSVSSFFLSCRLAEILVALDRRESLCQ